ncbi:MAG: PIN domain-containing protein [Akkermansiaceae bacterium]|nr:PIN domain-containing protein [Akkermansiaceae bacterium]
MNVDTFVDTNVLVYAIEGAGDPKSEAARDLLRGGSLAISVQVLNEFYHTVTSPRRLSPLTHDEAVQWLDVWKQFPVQDLTRAIHDHGVQLREKFQIGLYDALVVAAGLSLGCTVLFTEDLNHGQDYDGLVARNPFRQ